jgi:hypothetical protein
MVNGRGGAFPALAFDDLVKTISRATASKLFVRASDRLAFWALRAALG